MKNVKILYVLPYTIYKISIIEQYFTDKVIIISKVNFRENNED